MVPWILVVMMVGYWMMHRVLFLLHRCVVSMILFVHSGCWSNQWLYRWATMLFDFRNLWSSWLWSDSKCSDSKWQFVLFLSVTSRFEYSVLGSASQESQHPIQVRFIEFEPCIAWEILRLISWLLNCMLSDLLEVAEFHVNCIIMVPRFQSLRRPTAPNKGTIPLIPGLSSCRVQYLLLML